MSVAQCHTPIKGRFMKISLTKAIAVAVLVSGFASQAYAEHPTSTQGKRIEANEAYWKGHPQSGSTVQTTNNDYPVTQQQRMAKRSAEYFAAKGNTGSGAAITKNPDYEFATTPAQRTAKRNYDYFSK
jgi:hypothetical protein